MCGRFFIAEEDEDELLSLMIEEASARQRAIIGEGSVARGEVFPSDTAAALAVGRNGAVGAYPMQWGFHRPDQKGLIINTRSETALEKPMFRQSMLERRCLIPCSWYYEWGGEEGQPNLLDGFPSLQAHPADPETDKPRSGKRAAQKIKYAIRPRRSGLIFLAAIYRYEEALRLPVFSILTREPAQEIAFIHDRMPVIFSDSSRGAWLDRAADPAAVLAQCETDMIFKAA